MGKTNKTKARYDVFLSHHGKDKSQIEVLATRLTKEEGLAPFLDKWHLVPGEPWQEGLENALDQSATCAVFLGSHGLGTWENEEMRAALEERVRKRSFRVIPVLLPGAKPQNTELLPRFLRRLTWVDFRAGLNDQNAFKQLVAGIRGRPLGYVNIGPVTFTERVLAQIWQYRLYLGSVLLPILLWLLIAFKQPGCPEFSADLKAFNKNQWAIPPSAPLVIDPSYGLSLSQNSVPIFLSQDCYYRDFVLRFHATLGNSGGAAWAVRIQGKDDYYLFYLAGPDNKLLDPGFYSYTVRDNIFDAHDHQDFVRSALASKLGQGMQFEIVIEASGRTIKNSIILGLVDGQSPTIPGIGEEVPLDSFEDPHHHFAKGSIGFRTIGAENFFVDSLLITPKPTQSLLDILGIPIFMQ